MTESVTEIRSDLEVLLRKLHDPGLSYRWDNIAAVMPPWVMPADDRLLLGMIADELYEGDDSHAHRWFRWLMREGKAPATKYTGTHGDSYWTVGKSRRNFPHDLPAIFGARRNAHPTYRLTVPEWVNTGVALKTAWEWFLAQARRIPFPEDLE